MERDEYSFSPWLKSLSLKCMDYIYLTSILVMTVQIPETNDTWTISRFLNNKYKWNS